MLDARRGGTEVAQEEKGLLAPPASPCQALTLRDKKLRMGVSGMSTEGQPRGDKDAPAGLAGAFRALREEWAHPEPGCSSRVCPGKACEERSSLPSPHQNGVSTRRPEREGGREGPVPARQTLGHQAEAFPGQVAEDPPGF